MISSENVHCSSASVVPSFWLSGPVNSVQTYCGEEIAIIAMMPRTSWFQRLACRATRSVWVATLILVSPPPTDASPQSVTSCRHQNNPDSAELGEAGDV